MHRQARGPGRGIPAVPAHLDNNHVLRLGDSLVLFPLRLLGSHLLLMLIVDKRPGTTANHGDRDNNARHDSGNLARVLLLGRIRAGTRFIGKGLGRNRSAVLARSGNGLGHQCGFINRSRARHTKVRRHDVERFMGSSRIGAVLLGICIGLLRGQGARLDFALCLRDVRSIDLRSALRAELGAIRQRRSAMRTDRIGRRLWLGPNRSRERGVIARLETCPAHGAELSVCRNVVATMRADAGGGAQHRRCGRGLDLCSAFGAKHRVVSDFAMTMSTNHERILTWAFSIWTKYKPTNGTRSSSFTGQRGSECSKNLPDVPRYMRWHPCNKSHRRCLSA